MEQPHNSKAGKTEPKKSSPTSTVPTVDELVSAERKSGTSAMQERWLECDSNYTRFGSGGVQSKSDVKELSSGVGFAENNSKLTELDGRMQNVEA